MPTVSAFYGKSPWRLSQVEPLENYTLKVTFNDNTSGYVKLAALILSKKAGVFAKLKEKKVFNQVKLVLGVATWPGEIDLAPDAMYDAIKEHGHFTPG